MTQVFSFDKEVLVNFDVFNNLDFPVSIISEKGDLLFKNKSFLKMVNLDLLENGISLDVDHPFYPEYRKRIASAYHKALEGENTKCFAVIKGISGKQIPVEIYLYPMSYSASEKAILAFFKEVDDRVVSFDKTVVSADNSEYFENTNLFEFSPFPILRVNSEKEITAASVSSELITGFSCRELIDNSENFFAIFAPYDKERISTAISEVIDGNQNFKRLNDLHITTKNEEEKSVNAVIYPLKKNKKISFAEILFEDVTKIKKIEKKLGNLNKNHIVGNMTEGLLHSFNNVINIISSRSQMLMQLNEKPAVYEGLKIIFDSAEEGANQIRRIQDFITRSIESDLSSEADIVSVIEDAIEFAKIHFKVEHKQKKRSVKIVKQYYVKKLLNCNIKILKEIFVSMIFKAAAGIKAEGVLNVELKESNGLVFSVSVDKKYIEDETYEQTDTFIPDIELRRIAEKINVRIYEEESAETMLIKAVLPSKMIIENSANEEEMDLIMIRDLDILVIEDESALKEILFELFDTMGNRVVVCEDGHKGLELFKNNHFDIVISDYGLVGISGFEVLTKVRESNEKTLNVLLSGWILNDISTYNNIIDLYLPKPFQIEVLLKEMSRVYRKKIK
ncbi:MAG: response regulator [Spirochaetes bacterium]|nr:response regulator [Spirochaetota bacterium]